MLRLWQAIPLSIALGVLSLWLVLPNLSLSDISTALGDLDPRLVPAIVVVVVGWWFVAGLRTYILSAQIDARISLWSAIQTHVFGAFSSTVTPAGGGNSLGVAFLLMRYGLSPQNATAVTVMTVVGDMTFFAWSVPAGFVLLTRRGLGLPIDNLPLFILGLSALSLGASYVLVFRLPFTTRIVARLIRFRMLKHFQPRIDHFLKELGLASERFARLSWTWHLGFHALSSLARVLYFTTFNLILLALGLDLGQLATYAFQIVIHNFAFIVPTPGASGYQEVAITYALKGQIPSGSLSAAVLLWRLSNHYLYFIIGPLIGGFALLTARPRRRSVAKSDVKADNHGIP